MSQNPLDVFCEQLNFQKYIFSPSSSITQSPHNRLMESQTCGVKGCRGFDPCVSRQIDIPTCLPGALLAGIKNGNNRYLSFPFFFTLFNFIFFHTSILGN